MIEHPTHWRWMRRETEGKKENPLQSFAYDDVFCQSVGIWDSPPILHTWVHDPTIVLGTQDSRLHTIQRAKARFEDKGYTVIVRNSGGLAVYLDPGVLNVSLIIKDEKGQTIDATYDKMWKFVEAMYDDAPGKIEAKEIVGSYCPGNYDLSIHDKKFAGISQRRLRSGIAVQVYIAVTGSGSLRAEQIKHFYDEAEQYTDQKVMTIRPETMASLSDLYGKPMTVNDSISRIERVFEQRGITLENGQLTESERHLFNDRLELVEKRNRKILEP
ncbi:biotin/lipoate A/B protein ligase family protein [Geomicrobium sp. JSM 1781026]|uniref:lipoate--protein ligase family protein n=1 Tax=Geomicrobium sp. JSM 1781026 TaxID=3344580 RepID=UPI0035C1AEAD